MEETANPTPSATLAPEMPTAVGEPKAKTTSIKLLIKASNQQHDDQIIESDLMWTVFRLKTQLSLVYPSKPPVSEQKLIYSGQLLNDCAQLKDIIRSYKDVYTQNHILHLVYTPKNQPIQPQNSTRMTTSTNNTDGLRQRQNVAPTPNSVSGNININTNTTSDRALQQTNRQQLPASNNGRLAPGMHRATVADNSFSLNDTTNSFGSGFNASLSSGFDLQNMAIQQAAMYNWMWQTYMQYMQQFQNTNAAQMPTSNSPSNTTYSTNPFNPVIAFPSSTSATFFSQPYLNQQNQIQSSIVSPSSQQREPLPEQQQQPQPQQQQQEQQEQVAAQPQPRFLNIVQDEQENRDWLDSFFSIMRLALFLTILYFNTSAIRCFMVFLIAGAIYLYHIGFFRTRQERNNNDINRNNNAAADPAQQDGQQQDQANNDVNQPQNENINDSTAAGSTSDSANADVASIAAEDAAALENNSTSVIAFMRSFIVSFFTSLLPETPAAL